MPHNHDIEAPKSAEYDHEVDRKNKNEFWRKEIENEIHAAGLAFDILEEKDKVPYG